MSSELIWKTDEAFQAKRELRAAAALLRNHSYVFSSFEGFPYSVRGEVEDTYRRAITTIIRLEQAYDEAVSMIVEGDALFDKADKAAAAAATYNPPGCAPPGWRPQYKREHYPHGA